ncbi:MAG: bifunctional 4-hydroxy-2-oxoglutarate aldolase/2-dehydro-3-deoxy-phosphogluconate aldolase [bacterium]|nr:bifunctional 4-hydroxy-2-oxoglutarate aldolase/2-dehydro-3-deoxy-phosphogluconate aldolase [bacterium]
MSDSSIQKTLDRILDAGVIVAVRIGPGAPVLDICEALAAGGLSVLELTLTTPGALDAIAMLSTDEDLVVGAGTVLSREDVRNVAEVGGRFTFSPVFDPDVLDEAKEHGLLAVPGTSTPTEILKAHRYGARLVKVFPAGPLGGPAYLRVIRGPLPNIPLVPTSGPTADSLADYVGAGAVAVGVGGVELFAEGFTVSTVKAAARRIRQAMDALK